MKVVSVWSLGKVGPFYSFEIANACFLEYIFVSHFNKFKFDQNFQNFQKFSAVSLSVTPGELFIILVFFERGVISSFT